MQNDRKLEVESVVSTSAERRLLSARWERALHAVAPGMALRVKVVTQETLDAMKPLGGRECECVGRNQAARSGDVIYLSCEVLRANSGKLNGVNLHHEIAHACEDMLPESERTVLLRQWHDEMTAGRSLLQDLRSRGEPIDPRAFDTSRPEHFSEWFAERIAWENERHFSIRIASHTALTRVSRAGSRVHRWIAWMACALRPEISPSAISSRYREITTGGGIPLRRSGWIVPQVALRDLFQRKAAPAGQPDSKAVNSPSDDTAPLDEIDPITGTTVDADFERAINEYHGIRTQSGGGSDSAQTSPASGLAASDHSPSRTGVHTGHSLEGQSPHAARSRVIGQAIKGWLARHDGQCDQSASDVPKLISGYSAEVETTASQLLARPPEDVANLPSGQRQLLADIRPLIPFVRESDFLRHIDADHLLKWLKNQEDEGRGLEGLEAHRHFQGMAEGQRTISRLFPAGRDGIPGLDGRLQKIASQQMASGQEPRLQILGVGGEGAVFNDRGGRGAYKIHPGGAEDAAAGIGVVRPGEKQPTYVSIFRVPLTEALRRYARQSLLSISSPTEIKGVTENGRLITRQPLLDADRVTTDDDISRMMAQVGGLRIQVEGKGKELQHSYVVPDGEGNYLLAVDLKPLNVLRNRFTGEARLTDGVVASITQAMIDTNPQLAPYAPAKPEVQFARRRNGHTVAGRHA